MISSEKMIHSIFVSECRIVFEFTKSGVVCHKVKDVSWVMARLKSDKL